MQPPDILRITPSGVRTFKECAHAFALTYVQPLPEAERRPVPALVLGAAVHAVAARFVRTGGWQRRGLDELMALLNMTWKADAYTDPHREAADFARARDLVQRFFESPYPATVEKDLGIERSLAWRRPRRGLLAAGRVDRLCWLPGKVLEVVDLKTGRPPREPESLRADPQTLIYRSIAADCYRWLEPERVVVSYRYLASATTLSVEFDDIVEFIDLWSDVEATADGIRAARREHAAGASLATAFPLNRGEHCRGCQFGDHCDRLVGRFERLSHGGGAQP